MNLLQRINLTMIIFILAAGIFILDQTLTIETKTQIYRFFVCGSCPHQDLQKELREIDQYIKAFKQRHPNIDEELRQIQIENEECERKLNANHLEAAKEELQVCQNTMKEILSDMAAYSQELKSRRKAIEDDLAISESQEVQN